MDTVPSLSEKVGTLCILHEKAKWTTPEDIALCVAAFITHEARGATGHYETAFKTETTGGFVTRLRAILTSQTKSAKGRAAASSMKYEVELQLANDALQDSMLRLLRPESTQLSGQEYGRLLPRAFSDCFSNLFEDNAVLCQPAKVGNDGCVNFEEIVIDLDAANAAGANVNMACMEIPPESAGVPICLDEAYKLHTDKYMSVLAVVYTDRKGHVTADVYDSDHNRWWFCNGAEGLATRRNKGYASSNKLMSASHIVLVASYQIQEDD